jgi:hypothetical protein
VFIIWLNNKHGEIYFNLAFPKCVLCYFTSLNCLDINLLPIKKSMSELIKSVDTKYCTVMNQSAYLELIPWSRILLEQLTVLHIVKPPQFMEPIHLLRCPEEPAAGPYSKPN